jgi:hypothetical protein
MVTRRAVWLADGGLKRLRWRNVDALNGAGDCGARIMLRFDLRISNDDNDGCRR